MKRDNLKAAIDSIGFALSDIRETAKVSSEIEKLILTEIETELKKINTKATALLVAIEKDILEGK